jgi:hypothetical protein
MSPASGLQMYVNREQEIDYNEAKDKECIVDATL